MKILYVGDNGQPAISQKFNFCSLEMEFFTREKEIVACNFSLFKILQARNATFPASKRDFLTAILRQSNFYRTILENSLLNSAVRSLQKLGNQNITGFLTPLSLFPPEIKHAKSQKIQFLQAKY